MPPTWNVPARLATRSRFQTRRLILSSSHNRVNGAWGAGMGQESVWSVDTAGPLHKIQGNRLNPLEAAQTSREGDFTLLSRADLDSKTRRWHCRHRRPISAPNLTTSHSDPPQGWAFLRRTVSPSFSSSTSAYPPLRGYGLSGLSDAGPPSARPPRSPSCPWRRTRSHGTSLSGCWERQRPVQP